MAVPVYCNAVMVGAMTPCCDLKDACWWSSEEGAVLSGQLGEGGSYTHLGGREGGRGARNKHIVSPTPCAEQTSPLSTRLSGSLALKNRYPTPAVTQNFSACLAEVAPLQKEGLGCIPSRRPGTSIT
jgi:hypothetical protein